MNRAKKIAIIAKAHRQAIKRREKRRVDPGRAVIEAFKAEREAAEALAIMTGGDVILIEEAV